MSDNTGNMDADAQACRRLWTAAVAAHLNHYALEVSKARPSRREQCIADAMRFFRTERFAGLCHMSGHVHNMSRIEAYLRSAHADGFFPKRRGDRPKVPVTMDGITFGSMSDCASHFGLTQSAVNHWVKQGKAHQLPPSAANFHDGATA